MGGYGGAGGTAGAGGAAGRGIVLRSAPHLSQYFASSSFLAPHRLQNIVDHPRLMLPVDVLKVTWNFMDVDGLS